jgi:hypothetical protein
VLRGFHEEAVLVAGAGGGDGEDWERAEDVLALIEGFPVANAVTASVFFNMMI